jgi:endoglucanase
MCSLLYSPGVTLNTSSSVNPSSEIQNATYAAQLRTHAEDAYSFAMNATMELYPLSVPDAGSAYNSSTYGDDLVGPFMRVQWPGRCR